MDVENSVGFQIDPTIGVACEWGLSDVLRVNPRFSMIARAHWFFHGDEEHTTAGCDANARLFAGFTNIAEHEIHSQWFNINRLSCAVGDEDSLVPFGHDFFFHWFFFSPETAGHRKGRHKETEQKRIDSHESACQPSPFMLCLYPTGKCPR